MFFSYSELIDEYIYQDEWFTVAP